jgi:Spy/CpxP family protein refolding chaperone
MQLANILVRLRGALALRDPEVATLLKLSDTQQIKIRDVNRRNVASLRARIRERLRSHDRRGSIRESLRELEKESQQHVVSILTTEQRRKFEQLGGESAISRAT